MKRSFRSLLRFYPLPLTSLVFFLLLGFNGLLFYGRKSKAVQIEMAVDLFPEFYTHISNFCISFLLLGGVGYSWLLFGVGFRQIIYAALGVIAANFIWELWLPLLNTRDISDAWFGLAGTILAVFFLGLTAKFGLKPVLTEPVEKC